MSNLTCHHDRVPTQTSSGPCVRVDPVACEAPQTTLRQLAPSRVAHTEKQNPLTCSRRHLAIPGGGVTRTRTGQTESALTPPWPSATAAKPTAKHIPQHRTDIGCAPDKAQTLTGRRVLSGCARALRRKAQGMVSSPPDHSLGPHLFLTFFRWLEATQERRGRLVKAAFFAPRSGRSEAQSLDWPPALSTLASGKTGDYPFPWPPSFSRCVLFLSACRRTGG
jgi:hypothetical protein